MSMKTRSHHHAHQVEMAHTHVETSVLPEIGMSDQERFRSIQVRAYAIWEHAGRPEGVDSRVRCWCDAEKEFPTSPTRMG